MFNRFNRKSIAGMVLAGVLMVTGITTALAADQAKGGRPFGYTGQRVKMDPSKMAGTVKSTLGNLVSAGTITQEQADAIVENIPSNDGKRGPGGERKNPMSELISEGTITQEQADAIAKSMPANDGRRGPGGERKNPMAELISAGTITQEQADAINEALKAAMDAALKAQ